LRAQQQGEIQTQQATIARLQAELRNAISEDRRYWQLYEQGAISASTSDSKSLAAETAQQQLNEGKAKLNQIRQSGQQQINEAQAKLNQIQNRANSRLTKRQPNSPKLSNLDTSNGKNNAFNFDWRTEIRSIGK
jgi:HlyD family secretion protein